MPNTSSVGINNAVKHLNIELKTMNTEGNNPTHLLGT